VPERRALLARPVDPPLDRVDVDKGQRVGTGQQWGLGREPGQHPAMHRRQLGHVAVVERAQERAQRRGGPDPAERGRERAVAQQVHPVDVVGAGDHPRQQRPHLASRVRPDLRGHAYVLVDQLLEPDVLGQPRRAHQPAVRHQIRVVEPRGRLARSVQQSHLRGALPPGVLELQ